jgi:type IV secretory pathway TrbF-like protein
MRFRRAVQRYGKTPGAVTPYQKAAQVWDERIGSARVQARNWRLMAMAGLILSTGLSAGLVWQSLQSRIVPYVVAVDRLGEARAVSPADKEYQPTDPQIAWHLAHFIGDVRTVSLDPVLMRQHWMSAYDFVTPRGARFLSDYARSADPFGEVGTRTVSVQVTSVVRASDRSFQVKWTESRYERGESAGTSHWTAMISVVMRPPGSAETLRRNPLGLYVDAIDWSQELDTAAAGGAASPQPAASSSPPRDIPLGPPLDPLAGAPIQQTLPSTRNSQ